MKKLVFVMFSVFALNANAQLVVKETVKDTVVWQYAKTTPVPKLVRFGEDTYTMYYRNAQYTAITDIQYITIGNLETTKQFFELCKSAIVDNKEYSLDLGGKPISLKKVMKAVMISESGSYFYLNDKWVDQILEKL